MAVTIDSSDEESAPQPSAQPQPSPTILPEVRATKGTQTIGTWMDHVQELAECFGSLTVLDMKPLKDQFWAHMMSCIKMPRGGLNGGGSMHSSFEMVVPNEICIQYLMEDLPLEQNKRYNLSLPPPHWEDSQTISTYHALSMHLIDSWMRLHRRRAARNFRAYRGSALAAPPDTYTASVALLTVCPPLLIELCHRQHHKLVLAVSFNLAVHNDELLQTLPPRMLYVVGMDVLIRQRALNHLKKLRARGEVASGNFAAFVDPHISTLSASEGEWVAPPSDLQAVGFPVRSRASLDPGSDSGGEADHEAEVAASNLKRARATGSRWEGRMRH